VDVNKVFEAADKVCRSVSEEFDTIVENPGYLELRNLQEAVLLSGLQPKHFRVRTGKWKEE